MSALGARGVAFALGVSVALLPACEPDGAGPRLTSAVPTQAIPGAMVELTGTRFCADHVACAGVSAGVQLGLSPPIVHANIVEFSDTRATFAVPTVATPGETDIVLTVDGLSSNALDFEVLP